MPESVIVDYKQAMFGRRDVESLRAEFAGAWPPQTLSATLPHGRLSEYYDARKEELVVRSMSYEPLYKIASAYASSSQVCRNGPDDQTIADTWKVWQEICATKR